MRLGAMWQDVTVMISPLLRGRRRPSLPPEPGRVREPYDRIGFAEAPVPAIQEFGRAPRVSRGGNILPFAGTSPGDDSWDGPGTGITATFATTGPQGHRGRMRERLLERGADSLADYEVLEMLLFFAFKQGDTKPLAKALINRYGSFAAVLAAPQAELMGTRGLGDHSVAALKLVQAAALRMARAEVTDRPLLNSWDRLTDYLVMAMAREKVEQFRVLFLDTKNRLLADEVLGRGTVNHTPAYPREVMKRCLDLGATAMILVHNHPSGDATPSRADKELTAEISDAARLLGVVVHDHLIVGGGEIFSFRRAGLL